MFDVPKEVRTEGRGAPARADPHGREAVPTLDVSPAKSAGERRRPGGWGALNSALYEAVPKPCKSRQPVSGGKLRPGSGDLDCSIFSRRFSEKSAVPPHERTHTGEKPYACSMCPRRGAQTGRRCATRADPHGQEAVRLLDVPRCCCCPPIRPLIPAARSSHISVACSAPLH